MSNSSIPQSRLWDRRTIASAALSIVLATGVTLTVCAAKGDLDPGTAKSTVPSCTAPVAAGR